VAAGNVLAELLLGHAHLQGLGVPQDDARAFTLFSQAAAAANPVAQMELGYLYFTGRGVAQDKYQGLQWTVKAAEQGNGTALGNIAEAYIKGEVVGRDTDRAGYFLALANQRASPGERNEMVGISRQVRAAISVEDLGREAKRAQRWTPRPGSLDDVLSDAEDFRRHHK
jgi:TPR repeat protein